MTPTPGILSVNSDTINPLLSKPDFDTWYCNEHIPDVVSKSGISHAYRYRTLPSSPSRKLNFLTIYGMQDIGFMESAEFKSVEGQSPGPSRGRIFEKAEFDTRSYGLVDVNGDGDGDGDGGKLNRFLGMRECDRM